MYELIKNKYINSSFKIKIELYLFPILVLLLLFSLIDFDKNINQEINHQTNFLKKFDGSLYEISNEIQKFCTKNKIKLFSIKINKSNIKIKGNTNILKIKKLIKKIDYINNYTNIKSFFVQKKSNNFDFALEIDFKQYFIKNERNHLTISKKDKRFVLKAIIDENIFINNKWFKTGEYIDGYKINKIDENKIVLIKDDKKLLLRVHKNGKN